MQIFFVVIQWLCVLSDIVTILYMSYDIFIVNNFVVKYGFKKYGSAKLHT